MDPKANEVDILAESSRQEVFEILQRSGQSRCTRKDAPDRQNGFRAVCLGSSITLSQWTTDKIAKADLSTLEEWSSQILDAPTLKSVLTDTP
jgi:hypothetical protein